jgi:hypothetical protein
VKRAIRRPLSFILGILDISERVLGMHPNDAKAIVHFSGAWEDYRKPQERFEESFFKTFEKVEAEDDSPEIFEEINSDDDEN